MKVPYSWLAEFAADLPAVDELAEALSISGTAVEEVHHRGLAPDAPMSLLRIGRVEQCDQHPNADRLSLCMVDAGEGELRQIVCGAPNVRAGATVAVALPGAQLPGGITLKPATLRGVESSGMLLSERELELSDSHDGIMLLDDTLPVGAPLSDHLSLSDALLTFEITSNRPDCLGVYGIAREAAATANVPLSALDVSDPNAGAGAIGDALTVAVEDPDLCPRYMARMFEGITVAPSPAWLQQRLLACGMRPVNNVVDVTNYVMLCTGQPLHAFDADRLRGGALIVRRAADGESITTLDDVERMLTNADLVIADSERPAVIAGVMGAADVEVSDATRRVALEAACFDGPTILRTSQRLALRSEASGRFEKRLDPHSPQAALSMASRMLVEICAAEMLDGTIDVGGDRLESPPTVALRRELISATLGIEIADGEVERILTQLGCSVDRDVSGFAAVIPPWRMYDLTRPIDLVEELGRIHGLHNIPSRLPVRQSHLGALSRSQRLQRTLEDAAVGLGLHETITYSMVDPGYNARFGIADADVVQLDNPMSEDHVEMRATLLGSLLTVLGTNRAAGADSGGVFEIARTFTAAAGLANEVPVMALCATGGLWGSSFDGAGPDVDERTMRGIVDSLLSAAGYSCAYERVSIEFLHPGRAAAITVGGGAVGWVGEVHPQLATVYGLRKRVAAAQLDLQQLDECWPGLAQFQAISTFPPVRQDIALVVDSTVSAASVLETAQQGGGAILESVDIFDRYEGAPIPAGRYSLALRLVFRAPDRTLTDDEVATQRNEIVEALAERYGARLRDDTIIYGD